MVRRIVTTTAASLTALTVLAAPAWAGSSFTGGSAEAAADEDHTLVLTVTEPEDEGYGTTARVTATAPSGFTDVGCATFNTWQCTVDGATVTFTRTPTSLGSDLRFTVHTPVTNGTYAFAVTQFDGAEEPATASSAPAVTVTGGEDPSASSDDGGETGSTDGTDGGSTDGGADTTDDGTSDDTTSDSGTSGDDTSGDDTSDGSSRDAGDETSDPATGSGDSNDTSTTTSDDSGDPSGSTAPRRTEGRSSGTTLEITPGDPEPDDTDPSVAAPAVADEPAVAPPDESDSRDEDTETATMTAIEGEAPPQSGEHGDGLPWQQLLGGALVAVAAAVVAVRRWDVLARFRS